MEQVNISDDAYIAAMAVKIASENSFQYNKLVGNSPPRTEEILAYANVIHKWMMSKI